MCQENHASCAIVSETTQRALCRNVFSWSMVVTPFLRMEFVAQFDTSVVSINFISVATYQINAYFLLGFNNSCKKVDIQQNFAY